MKNIQRIEDLEDRIADLEELVDTLSRAVRIQGQMISDLEDLLGLYDDDDEFEDSAAEERLLVAIFGTEA